MSKSISIRLGFTLLNERNPLKHRRDVLRMANEILILIQDIVVEQSSPFWADRSSASQVPCHLYW